MIVFHPSSSLSDPLLEQPNLSGTTALLVLTQRSHIATCSLGDSRAVLCRAGVALPLSCDHKPGLPAERERIERAGGRKERRREELRCLKQSKQQDGSLRAWSWMCRGKKECVV